MKIFLCSLFFMAISLTLLSACDSGQTAETQDWEPTIYETVNNLDGVTMIVKGETVSSTGLTVTLENKTDKRCVYSEDFLLEKKIEGKWYQVPIIKGASYGFGEPGYELDSDSSNVSDWTVDWEWLYGSLDIGEYRIVKSILDVRKPGDYDRHHLIAEFTID
ncbi:immunoglobulin-like domain-containing protein [Paucisalibacillus sp. EB02]|uniref:immunoglobulin-like domain-containing protein n=1 Tax=Paucisalibacillus sp. EB02 TaxID=1347087 RepID=UPI0006938C9F|nr:immunoglobulin-like domain-containing protein [Paucisalibacillus sp. EB02]